MPRGLILTQQTIQENFLQWWPNVLQFMFVHVPFDPVKYDYYGYQTLFSSN